AALTTPGRDLYVRPWSVFDGPRVPLTGVDARSTHWAGARARRDARGPGRCLRRSRFRPAPRGRAGHRQDVARGSRGGARRRARSPGRVGTIVGAGRRVPLLGLVAARP